MASPPILDFDALLAPIEGANPAGEPLPFVVRKKLDEARKEVNPNQFAENDSRRPQQAVPADWPAIEQLAQDTLAKTSKDLVVAARLLEALVKLHGHRGLRDGLRLMRRMVQECWDRIHPLIQEGDIEARAGAFDWLDDDVRGARFPYTMRMAPLAKTDDGAGYGWQHWKDSQDGRGSVTAEAFDHAVLTTPREFCQTVVDDIGESVNELVELGKVLSAQMGEAAPTLSQVRRALVDCQTLAQLSLQRKGPAPAAAAPQEAAAAPAEADGAAQPSTTTAKAAPRPMTRDDVLNRLADASALLLQMEPQSPIAYMIQRAVRLARLPFPDLMRVLVRDAGVLGQLDRDLDLGLEKSEAAKEAAKAGKGK